MKRFRRWIFDSVAVISLLFCIATAVLWVRSNKVTDELTILTSSGKWVLQSSAGVLRCYFTRMEASDNWVWGSRVYWVNEPANPIRHQPLEWHCVDTVQIPPGPGKATWADRGGSLWYLFPIVVFAWMPLRVFIFPRPILPLPRWLFTGSAALSALVCITVAVLWIPSYWHYFGYESGYFPNNHGVFISEGSVGLREMEEDRSRTRIHNPPYDWDIEGWGLALASFRTFESINGPIYYIVGFFAPCWLTVLLSGVAPYIWLRRRKLQRANRTPDSGLCRKCGYDLRATPDLCPECGTVPNKTH